MKLSALATILTVVSLGTAHAQEGKGGFITRPYLVFESNGRPGKSTKSSPSITGKSGKSDITSPTKGKSSKCFTAAPPAEIVAGIDELSMSSMMLGESYSMSSLSFDASAAIHGSKGGKSYSESGSKGSKSKDSGVDTRVPNCDPSPPIVGVSAVIARDDAVSLLSTSPPVVIDVLENDASFPSGAELFISSVSNVDPASGTCSVNGDTKSIVYTPPVSPLFVGDVVCQYETCIVGEPTCSSANVIISVLPEVVAEDDIVLVLSTSNSGESINVLENDETIPSGYSLIVQAITSPPAFGTAVVSIDNADVLYTPDVTFTGEVSFEYEACYVGGDSCDTAVVTVTIVPVVDAVDDAASVSILASINGEVVDVLANDATFPSGQAINVTAITRNPSEGTSAIAADKSAVVYTPPSDFIGEVTFEYEACLEDGTTCDKANVTISVEPEVVAVTLER